MGQYDPVFEQAAQEWNLDPTFLRAVSAQESGGKTGAVSPKGARGLMQIMPATASGLGVTDPADPVQNIYAGAKYLSEALDNEKTPEDALRYYHGGPGWRDSYGPESKAYAPGVTAKYQQIAANAPGKPQESPPVPSAAPAPADPFTAALGAARKGAAASPEAQADPFTEALTAAKNARRAPETPANEAAAAGTPELPSWAGGAQPAAAPAAAAPTDPDHPYAAYKFPDAPATDSEGHLLSDTETPGSVAGRVGRGVARVGEAAMQTYRDTPNPLMSPALRQQIEQAGPVGNYLTSPLLQIGGGALAAVGAGFRGLQQGLVEAGGGEAGPGRDAAAFLEAAPFMPSMGPLRAAAELRARASSHPLEMGAPAPEAAPPPGWRVLPIDEAAPPGMATATDKATGRRYVQDPAARNPLAGPEAGMPAPQSVGASASRDMSPPSVVDLTTAEMKANRRQAEKADLLAPPEPGDTTTHVKGSLPTKAEYSGDPTVSQQEVMLRARNPDAFEGKDGRLTDNTKARIDHYDNMVPSDTSLQRMEQDRSAQAEKDTAAIMAKAKPADLSPALKVYDSVLNDARSQERDAVMKILGPLRDKLFANGNLKTDPQSVWGIHDDLMNKLETAKDGTAAERFVKKELTLFKQSIDGVMNTATDNHFQTFLNNYAAKSQEINSGNLLREFRDKLTNGKGEIMANRFHNFVVDLAENRGNKGLDPAMDIPDEKMQGLISLDKDLKRAGLIDLGKARGSPTDLFGTLARGMGIVGAHAGALATSPGIGNVIVHQGLKTGENMLGSWRLKSQTKKHLAPPPGGYRNYLDPNSAP